MKAFDKSTWALIALATTFFGIGITEFIGVGVLPLVSEEFSIPTSTAGRIVSLYALGVAIGGVVLTALASRFDRKSVVLAAIALFIAGHIFTALAGSFGMLLLARIVSATAHGLFFALASAIAVKLVAPGREAGAIAFIFGGFTIATAFAAPFGTYLSGIFGWRIPFFGIAAVGVAAFFLNRAAIPSQRREGNARPVTAADQVRLISNPHVLLMLVVTILGYGGTFATFTYISPILQEITRLSPEDVSAVLVLYGVAIAIGNYIGGRLGNSHPLKSLTGIFTVQAAVLLALHFTAPFAIPGIATVAGIGFMAFMSIPALQSYIMLLARRHVPQAVDLASALNIASFNGGIFVGTGLGGLAIDKSGLAATPVVAAAMVAASLILVQVSRWMDRREERTALEQGPQPGALSSFGN